jgi:hypothetical protein
MERWTCRLEVWELAVNGLVRHDLGWLRCQGDYRSCPFNGEADYVVTFVVLLLT